MATIKIQRTSEYNNRMRDYKIFIDGQKIGTIANGETKDFSIPVGQHTVTAKIDWCSSQDLTIKTNETEIKELKVGGFKNGKWIMPIAAGLVALHFILNATIGFNYGIVLGLPLFVLLFYYFTSDETHLPVGRNLHLHIILTVSYNCKLNVIKIEFF